MSEPNVIETERLALRRLTLNDLDALAAIYSDEDVRQYFPEGILTYEQTKEELEWIINVYYGQYGFGLWATTLKETNEFIGRCGLLGRHDKRDAQYKESGGDREPDRSP